MPKPQIIHDGNAGLPNTIQSYMHCGKCLRELPPFVSPKEFSRTQIGITKTGAIQVWCSRHELNVDTMTIKMPES